jgi:hypothetical protein
MEHHRWFRWTRSMAIILGFVVPMAGALPARAANTLGDPLAPSDTNDEASYRKTVRDGVAEYDAGHFEEARSLFRRAHETNPNARTFRGIGMASFELRDYIAAWRYLSAALQDKRKPLSPAQRKDVQDLLDRSRMFLDVYTVRVVPRTARLTVDGRAPEFEPDGTLLFGFGAHTIAASAPGMATHTESMNVRGGARKELLLSLEPAPVLGAHPADAASPVTVMKAAPPPRASNRAAAAWLWAGAGAAVVAAGAGAYWIKQASELHSCHNPPASDLHCRTTTEGTLSTERNVAMGVTLGTGAAALTMALIGFLTWKSGPSPAQHGSGLACIASPSGITCGGAF